MNREEVKRFYETIEYEIHKISSNEAYINNSRYFGLSRELLSYIRKLENTLDEIEECLNKHSEDLVDDYSLFSETSFYEELMKIIKKAKGDFKNES